MLKLQKHDMSSFGNHNRSSPKEAQNQENTIRASSAIHYFLLACGALTPQPTSEHDFFLLWLIASRSLHSRAHCKCLCTQLTPITRELEFTSHSSAMQRVVAAHFQQHTRINAALHDQDCFPSLTESQNF